MKHVLQLRNLAFISLFDTKVTGQGVLTLLEGQPFRVVYIDRAAISESMRQQLRAKVENADERLVHDPLKAGEAIVGATYIFNGW